MRFISGHSDTSTALERVAAPGKAFIVDHYFWSAGTVMQRSQEGLYRSILLQILSRIPETVPALPGVEEKTPEELESGRWDLDHLHAALDALATIDKISTILGVFIDGIDEYDGDHVDICRTLLRLSRSNKIKLCISSRPWNVFQDHFGNDKTAMLAVHDLTLNDIKIYVTARLKEHYRWKGLTARCEGAEVLIAEICQKAHRVFLWVFLVTKLLREGMTDDDSLNDLRRRLEVIPSDLESFFRLILDSVDPVYHDKMAGTLVMTLAASVPMKAQLYAFGEDEFDDAEYAIKQSVKVMDPNKKEAMTQIFVRRLNGRCKGLLETGPEGFVNLLHRTVRDSLRTKPMNDFLRSKNQTRLEPHLSIVKAYLSSIKQSEFSDGVERGEDGALLGSFLTELEYAFCHVVDEYTQSDQIVYLIDEMESATTEIFARRQARLEPGSQALTPRRTFRECVLLHGPVHYLSCKLASTPMYFMYFDEPPLAMFLRHTARGLTTASGLAMVKMLLESGEDLNQVFFDKNLGGMTTLWQRFISLVAGRQNSSAFLRSIIEELLSFGAPTDAMTQAPRAVKLGHKSALIPAWLNILFSTFIHELGQSRDKGRHLEVLASILEKGVDFRSMTLATFHLKGSDLPTITPWSRLSDLILERFGQRKLQSQALAKLAHFSGPNPLPWEDLMPVVRENFSDEYVEVIEEALAKRPPLQRGLDQPEGSKRVRSPEEPDLDTRETKRGKGG
ncbi:hypothetical protein PG996_002543 [Apiospora saccharicola]|uniref:NACHT domain-containing protein n=1 Tax=Apiospora saccharicola TaxID=335842 RepID=A0ABR1WJV0_9PEZI